MERVPNHARTLLREYGVEGCKGKDTPHDETWGEKSGSGGPLVGDQASEARRVIAIIDYVAQDRPDMAVTAKELSQRMAPSYDRAQDDFAHEMATDLKTTSAASAEMLKALMPMDARSRGCPLEWNQSSCVGCSAIPAWGMPESIFLPGCPIFLLGGRAGLEPIFLHGVQRHACPRKRPRSCTCRARGRLRGRAFLSCFPEFALMACARARVAHGRLPQASRTASNISENRLTRAHPLRWLPKEVCLQARYRPVATSPQRFGACRSHAYAATPNLACRVRCALLALVRRPTCEAVRRFGCMRPGYVFVLHLRGYRMVRIGRIPGFTVSTVMS